MYSYKFNRRASKPVKMSDVKLSPIVEYTIRIKESPDIFMIKELRAKLASINPSFVTVNLRTYRVKTRLSAIDLRKCIDAVVSCEVIAREN